MPKNTYTLGGINFTSKESIKKHVQSIFASYREGDRLTPQDEKFVRDLIEWHPSASQKIGCGIDHIKIHVPKPWTTKGFLIVRANGTTTDFSYRVCLYPQLADKQVKVQAAFRRAIAYQVAEFKKNAFANTQTVFCPVSQRFITWQEAHVDHYPTPFIDLFEDYIRSNNLSTNDIALLPSQDNKHVDGLADPRLEMDWQRWHIERAQLRIVDSTENVRMGAHGRTA